MNYSFGEQANDHSCSGLIGEMRVANGTHHMWPCRYKPLTEKPKISSSDNDPGSHPLKVIQGRKRVPP